MMVTKNVFHKTYTKKQDKSVCTDLQNLQSKVRYIKISFKLSKNYQSCAALFRTLMLIMFIHITKKSQF